MKKTLLITIGITLILVIGGVWLYLFTYGTPQSSDEVFAKFGIGGGREEPVVNPDTTIVDVRGTTADGAPQTLRQLTTRPVAGATFTGTGIMYVEQGTGHLYHINLVNGNETLVSGTTIPKAREAIFSPGGAYVAITAHDNGAHTTIVGAVPETSGALEGVALPDGATEMRFENASGTILYLLRSAGGATGNSYNVVTKKGAQLFSIPLSDVHVLWGNPHYVYTTPSAAQVGYLYKVSSGKLSFVTSGSIGLMGLVHESSVIVTGTNGTSVLSARVATSGQTVTLPLTLIPEKCASGDTLLFCGVPFDIPNPGSFPDDWYKGSVSLSDGLWSVDVREQKATLLSNFVMESGREVDVKHIGVSDDNSLIYLINKNDNSLWLFDTTM